MSAVFSVIKKSICNEIVSLAVTVAIVNNDRDAKGTVTVNQNVV